METLSQARSGIGKNAVFKKLQQIELMDGQICNEDEKSASSCRQLKVDSKYNIQEIEDTNATAVTNTSSIKTSDTTTTSTKNYHYTLLYTTY